MIGPSNIRAHNAGLSGLVLQLSSSGIHRRIKFAEIELADVTVSVGQGTLSGMPRYSTLWRQRWQAKIPIYAAPLAGGPEYETFSDHSWFKSGSATN